MKCANENEFSVIRILEYYKKMYIKIHMIC